MKKIIFIILILLVMYARINAEDRYLNCYSIKRIYSAHKYLLNCEVKGKDSNYIVNLDIDYKNRRKAKSYVKKLAKDAEVVVLLNPYRVEGNVLGAKDILITGEHVKETLKQKGWVK